MSKVLSLVKVILKENITFSKMKKKSRISSLLATLFIISIMILYIYVYTNMGIELLADYGYQMVIPVIAYILTFMVTIMIAFSITKNILFDSKDNDLLISLPLKNSQIFLARTISTILMNLGIAFIIFFMCNIFLASSLGLGIKYYLFTVLLTVFVPFVPTAISVVLSYLIAFLTSKLKNSKIVEIVINLIFACGILVFMSLISSTAQSFIQNAEQVKEFFSGPGYFIKTIYLVLTSYDIKALFIFIIVNLAIFTLTIGIFSIAYKKILFKNSVRITSNKKEVEYKKQEKLTALLKKEFKLYINSPTYFVNTFFGVIIFIIATIYILFTKADIIYKLMNSAEVEGLSITYFVLMLLAFVISTANTACSSISIEGKRLWILKTIPVDLKTIIRSKVIFNVLVIAPVLILCSIVIGMTLNLSYLTILFMGIFIVTLTYVIALFGMINNINFPKLNWQNEAQVVKQSASSSISIMVSMIVSMIVVSVFIYIGNVIGEKLAMAIIDISMILVAILLNRILYCRKIRNFCDLC